MSLSAKIEALLFYKAEPQKIKNLAGFLNVTEEEIRSAVGELEEALTGRGVTLIVEDDKVSLGTAGEMGELIEEITKQELNKDLGKAAVETLTVVLYKGPVSKSEIDYIRGVNTGFILRNLLIRGLVSRSPHPIDKRAYVYSPTTELLSFLGISKREELPEYKEMRQEIESFEKNFKEKEEDK